MATKQHKELLKRYVTPGDPIAFSSRTKLAKELKISPQEVNQQLLSYNFSYPLHRAYKKPRFNPYLNIRYPRQQIQCDLLDISKLWRYNKGIRFLLVCIDCFSRYMWVKTLKSKNADEMEKMFKELINDWQPELPKQLTVDRGTEFTNKKVHALLRENDIKVFHPTAEGKAVYVERANQTLQSLIFRYLTEKQTQKYVDVLQDLVKTYNLRRHRGLLNHRPVDAIRDENVFFFRRIEQNRLRPIIDKNIRMDRLRKNSFKVGDVVRIKKWKFAFDRGYKQTFSDQYYEIIKVNSFMPTNTYELKNMHDDEKIEGAFYPNELQLVKGDVYKVEKIIKSRRKNGVKQYYVKWLGFDKKFNQWINATDFVE